jgi:hypothetical protein
MVNRFKSETGYELGRNGSRYGARIDNLIVTISRENNSVIGGDRIMIKVTNSE